MSALRRVRGSTRPAAREGVRRREASTGTVVSLAADTATERVRERLRGDILGGRYASGDRLKIADVAARYGISPIPVREALRLLAGEGLVSMQAHRGAIVRRVDRAFIASMYDIRMALESLLVERAMDRIQASDLRRIRQAEQAYAKAAQNVDVRGMLDANAAFHGAINAISGNEEAIRMVERGWELIRAMRMRSGFTATRAATNVAQHKVVVEAIAARDVPAAVAAVREHCISGRDDLLSQLDQAA